MWGGPSLWGLSGAQTNIGWVVVDDYEVGKRLFEWGK